MMSTKPVSCHTILWADDDADDVQVVREILQKTDDPHQLIVASNGKEAVDYLNSIQAPKTLPCLVVLDINMPVLNGKEVLAIIRSRKEWEGVAVVVFTTSVSEKDHQYCAGYGVKMLSKPHSFSGFESMVAEILSCCQREEEGAIHLN